MTNREMRGRRCSNDRADPAHRVGARLAILLAMLSLAGATSRGHGQVKDHDRHALGTVDFRISCSERAQAEFDRAVALLHHMTYPRARESFQRVAETDPRCAMAHWGIAMTLFQPLWPTRPTPVELRRGWEAVQKATSLGPPTERAYAGVLGRKHFVTYAGTNRVLPARAATADVAVET